MNIVERLRNAVHHWPANVAALMADAAQRIETLEANQARDYCATPYASTAKPPRYYIEAGQVRIPFDGRGLRRIRPYWKIYDKAQKGWNGCVDKCVAYYYVEEAARTALDNLNNPVRVDTYSMAAEIDQLKGPIEILRSDLAEVETRENRILKEFDALNQVAVSRSPGLTLPEHIKHLEELAVDRLRLLNDQTAKLFAGQTAEHWYTEYVQLRCKGGIS